MIGDEYYHIFMTGTRSLVDSTRPEIDYDQAPKICRTCKSVLDRHKPILIRITSETVGPDSISFLRPETIGLIRQSFLKTLGIDVQNHGVHLGKVVNCDGKELRNWRSFICKETEIVRGYPKIFVRPVPAYEGYPPKDMTRYSCCTGCDCRIYVNGSGKPGYLLPRASRDRDAILESDLAGLLIPARILNGYVPKKGRGMGIEKIKVQAEPEDGYPMELPCPPFKRPWDLPEPDEPRWMPAKRRRDAQAAAAEKAKNDE